MITYDTLGSGKGGGNLTKQFTNLLSTETLRYLLDLKPSMGNIATGKGEVFLSVMCQDVSSDGKGKGDVSVGELGIEVKIIDVLFSHNFFLKFFCKYLVVMYNAKNYNRVNGLKVSHHYCRPVF